MRANTEIHCRSRWLFTVAVAGYLISYPWPVADAKIHRDAGLECLASAIYHESRGEPLKAQRAVVDKILHSSLDSGKTICEVIAEKHQFSWYKNKGLKKYDESQRELLAEALKHGKVLESKKFKFFYSGKKPYWAKAMACKPVGNLNFCKEKSFG